MQRTHAPDPVDQVELLVKLHGEDDEEDDGKDHFADGHGSIASIPGRSVADEDDQTEHLYERRGKKRERRQSAYLASP